MVACDECGNENDRADYGNYCTACRDAYMERTQKDPEYRPVGSMSPSTIDVAYETAYGQTVRLSRVVRCF